MADHRKKPVIRPAKNRRRVDKMGADGTLTIFHRGTEFPHYVVRPNWTEAHGPHIVIDWADQTTGSARSVIITLDAVTSIVRSLPLIATFARRLGPPKEQST